MPLRVGLDLVHVPDVARSIADHGERYLDRLLTPGERVDCEPDGRVDPQRVAARLAAKEATVKVLRSFAPWTSVEVRKDPQGWVEIALSGAAQQMAAQLGLSGFAVSITHEGDYASAVVIAELAETCRGTLHEATDP